MRRAALPIRRGGFTLVEVVVGVAVGGIVLTAGFAALATVQDRSVHARDAAVLALEGATARATLVEWLATAQLQSSELGVRFEGLDAEEHGLEWDELSFPMRAPTILRAPATHVRLFLDTDPETPERGLVAELIGRLGDLPRRVELVPGATGLLIRYLPAVDGPVEWAESWVGQPLPRAVELMLLDDPADPLPALLRFPIRVTMATLQ
jgi:prepilin-type N-terminal cleavage/methylation domain-containing protein